MMVRGKHRLLVSLAVLGAAVASTVQAQDPAPSNDPSLGSVYRRAVLDSNGDGLGDEITARVILPAHPSIQDVQAAANISARLGYETTAASLPIAMGDDQLAGLPSNQLPILVGRQNRFVKELAASGELDLSGLQPGQGLVAFVPQGLGERPTLVVVGADDAGTLAASIEVAARTPRLWSMAGVTLSAVEAQTVDYLGKHGIHGARAWVKSVVVDASRRGLADVRIEVTVPPDAGGQALEAFAALDRDHRFGRQIDTLDFAEVGSTTLMIRSSESTLGEVAVHRIGPSWRSLTSLSPAPAPLSHDALLKAAAATSAPPSATAKFHCVGCPVFRVDGMIIGGGGAGYSSSTPTEPAAAKPFDLAEVYTINGWYADRYRDLTPDATDTSIIVGGAPNEAEGAAEIAARLGLETTGITLPISRRDEEITRPANEPSPILVGRDNILVQALVETDKLRLDDLKPGEGAVQIVPRAYGTATATVVAGADADGARAASFHLARRLPYVWDTRPGSVTLQDLKTQVTDFLGARTAAGQAAQAIEEVSAALEQAKPDQRTPDSVDVKLYIDGSDPALGPYLKRLIEQQTRARRASVEVRAISTPVKVFADQVSAPWEGDDFWSRFKAEVLPRVAKGDAVEVEARLSEDPAVRARIARDTEAQLLKAGASKAQVEVRSAYKQGFFWLTEQVLPALKSQPVKVLHIKVRSEQPNYARNLQIYAHPARWIKELYPADVLFERSLGLPHDAFVIEQVNSQASVYSVEATDADGKVVYSGSFDPSIIVRNVLDASPGRSKVEVETGDFSARVNGATIAEGRIETDLERVWDLYQQKVLPKVREQLAQATKADGGSAPVVRDLRINVFMSEPDYDFGVEGEHISSPEGFGQDLANLTMAYLRTTGAPMPARVIPIILPKAGQPSDLSVTLEANAAAAPRVEVSLQSGGGEPPIRVVRDLKSIGVGDPQVTRIVARANALSEIGVQFSTSDPDAAARVGRTIQSLSRLQKTGAFKTDLSYDHVDALAISITAPQSRQTFRIANTGSSAPSDVRSSTQRPSGELVAWDHVINPPESEAIIGKLSYYPAVSAYRKARSYEGREISVLEITDPAAGDLVSTAKIAAYKPTALIVGRQHGSEPSSTSFILRLGEKLASDPAYEDVLRKVNVVLLPIMNPDGAALAAEIRQLRPLDIASPGYLSALGQDVTVSTTLPESVVDPYLWRRWLPDVYLNAHGASSHEVVQPFGGYVSSQAPTYAFRRGWYSLGFRTPLDPRYSDWTTAALALRDAEAQGIDADPEARAGDLKDYSRFERWGHRFAPHLEQLETYKDVMLFYTDRESGEVLGMRRLADFPPNTPEANRDARIGDWPLVTLDGGTIEAADEGAQGELLDLAARNGFAAALAQLKYLRDGAYSLTRVEEEAPGDGAVLTTVRVRPVMPSGSAPPSAPNG